MNRRDFIRGILAAGVVAVADPEKLLWVPGEKVYFIPSPKLVSLDIETVPFTLWGVPYHCSDDCTSSWLGFTRLNFATQDAIKQLIKTVQDHNE